MKKKVTYNTNIKASRTSGKSGTRSKSRNALSGKWTGIIIAICVLAIVGGIIGVGYYYDRVVPFSRTIITVDNTKIDMGYFIKRAKLAGADPMALLTSLTNEQLIKLGAAKDGIQATDADVTEQLRKMAAGGSPLDSANTTANITDNEFKEWYRQQLNESGLTNAEYRDVARTSVLATRLQQYLETRMPTKAEQAHVYSIVTSTYDDALKVKARWQAGEDFSKLAKEQSIDQSKENGGELGWVPRGILPSSFDDVIFSLATDNVSDPMAYTDTSQQDPNNTQSQPPTYYYVFKVPEKDPAREIDSNSLEVLKSKVLEKWLAEEVKNHQVSYNFNSETYAWINYQLAKSKPAQSAQSTGGQ